MNDNSVRYFSGWWAILFVFLSFNLIPIPFAILVNTLGDWVYLNPVVVDMNYLGEITMHPVADNLVSILSMTALLLFVLWRSTVRNIPISSFGSLILQRKDLFYGLIFLAVFIFLEEIYMFSLGLEMPEGFIAFMLSEPLILGIISVIIVAPIIEEFLFRGFLYSQLARTRLGGWGSVCLSSLLWTIIHFQYDLSFLWFYSFLVFF